MVCGPPVLTYPSPNIFSYLRMPRLEYCLLSKNCWNVTKPWFPSSALGDFSISQQIWNLLFFSYEGRKKNCIHEQMVTFLLSVVPPLELSRSHIVQGFLNLWMCRLMHIGIGPHKKIFRWELAGRVNWEGPWCLYQFFYYFTTTLTTMLGGSW